MTLLPLMNGFTAGQTVAYLQGRAISRQTVLQQVIALARQLPDCNYVVNLCQGHYYFLVTFLASLLAGKISLLPANNQPATLANLQRYYKNLYYLAEQSGDYGGLAGIGVQQVLADLSLATEPISIPAIGARQIAAITFTSGSTGQPKHYAKSWQSLLTAAQLTGQRLGLAESGIESLLATVPPQHMYGLEHAIMLPLQQGLAIYNERPFYPADLLAVKGRSSMLVSTPYHLKMFSLADNSYPEIKLIMASTAPLSQPLAQQVQARFGCPVWEIYGSTETGSVATRNPCLDQPWQLLPGIQLKLIKGSWLLSAAHLPETIVLQDCLELLGSSRFRWLGRNQDMVKIAGKRSSLSALNQQLTSIPGVLDGVFIKPETEPNHATGIRRLMALVVAPGATEASILAALRQCIEPVFLPRPLYLVDRLPRAANGKLTRASLEQLLNDLGTQS